MNRSPLFQSENWNAPATARAYSEALRICDQLQSAGHVAYFAGGCVRDALLGRLPKDFDIATDATPNRVRKIFGFRRTLAFGASFGVIGVLPEKTANQDSSGAKPEVVPTEVATFRSDGDYSDGRRPNEVTFGDAENDALRRDFTVNGLFYDPASERVIDFVGGEADLQQGVLRTIGDPHQRFGEDKLRMLRAVRFVTTLAFKVDPHTQESIRDHAGDIHIVSGERIGAEMHRVLSSPHAGQGITHLIDLGLDRCVWPGVEAIDQQRLQARLAAREDFSFASALAIVISLAEPNMLRDLTRRWRLANEEVRAIEAALKHWETIANAHRLPWSQSQPVLIHRDIHTIVTVAHAIVSAKNAGNEGIKLAVDALSWPTEKLNPAPLVTGDQLVAAGFKPGPQFRSLLEEVRNQQLDGQLSTADEAMKLIASL